MLMKHDLILKILRGDKTQTRRPYFKARSDSAIRWFTEKDDIYYAPSDYHTNGLQIGIIRENGRIKYRVGNTYAIQYGRGKPTCLYNPEGRFLYLQADLQHIRDGLINPAKPLRIRITQLRFEDVRNIQYDDCLADGFKGNEDFWLTWTSFYDKPAANWISAHMEDFPEMANDSVPTISTKR